MTISNLSILKKVSLLVVLMGVAAGAIAAAGAFGLSSLGASLQNTGQREEVAREAMDLRVDIIAISRMTYQLAFAPEKAADFAKETETRSSEMLARLPKSRPPPMRTSRSNCRMFARHSTPISTRSARW